LGVKLTRGGLVMVNLDCELDWIEITKISKALLVCGCEDVSRDD
jgi:hypothetical protein